MSKKRDPVLAVLKYFEEAELPLAEQALSLSGAIVAKRRPKPRPAPRLAGGASALKKPVAAGD